MYSFYGGRPGNSFVITKTYTSKEDMLTDFNSNNCQVHYDEYVLINNTDKLNKEHGNIYRRAYGIDENAAVFIGNIAGPPGAAPLIQFKDYDDSIFNDDNSRKAGDFKLVSGRTNNEIKWRSITQKNEDNDDSTTYVGVEIPYPVFDFQVEGISPYNQDTGTSIADTAAITKISDDNETPFYQKWKIFIPRGINGRSLESITVEEQPNHHRYMYGTFIDYSNIESGEESTELIGDLGFINEIQSITREGNEIYINLTDNSHPHFNITPTSSGVIQDVTYDKNTGRLAINDGSQHFITLHIPTNMTISQDGKIFTSWTDTADTTGSGQLKMPTNFQMTGRNLEIEWTNQSQKTILPICENYIIDAKINNNNHLLVKYFDAIGENNNQWKDLGNINQGIEYENTQLGPINWIGVGILNHRDTNDNVFTFDIPLTKTLPYSNLTITEGQLFSEDGIIDTLNLLSSNCQVEKTIYGLRFSINSINDQQIFNDSLDDSESQNTEIDNKEYYIKIKITNLILQLSNETEPSNADTTINTTEDTTEEPIEEEELPEEDEGTGETVFPEEEINGD